MISRRFSIWQKATALAPVLLLLVYLPAQAMLRCQMNGMVRPTCCCPHDGERERANPVIQAQDCCDRQAAQSNRPAAEAARPANRDIVEMAAVAFASAPVAVLAQPTERPGRAAQRYGPAREGPPLVLLKHAFLI